MATKAALKRLLLPNLGTNVPTEGTDEDGFAESDNSAVAAFSLTEKLQNDPAAIGFPAMLPVELALRTGPVSEIFAHYNLTQDDYHRLKTDEIFLAALAAAKKKAQDGGWSFRMKAALQSEELLKSSWTLIHSVDTPPNVKKDLIIATWRAAGLADPEQTENRAAGFSISINLG